MPRPALSGRANAGRATRIVLSTLVGLLSLLVVLGLPADGSALGGIPQARSEITVEQRPDTDPVASVRSAHLSFDLDEAAHHGRLACAIQAALRAGITALPGLSSDRTPVAADRSRPERPPRA